jgi:hypothetical protein
MEAMIKYTNLNPAFQEDHIFLHLQFINQLQTSEKKLQKLKEGPQTSS